MLGTWITAAAAADQDANTERRTRTAHAQAHARRRGRWGCWPRARTSRTRALLALCCREGRPDEARARAEEGLLEITTDGSTAHERTHRARPRPRPRARGRDTHSGRRTDHERDIAVKSGFGTTAAAAAVTRVGSPPFARSFVCSFPHASYSRE